MKNFCLQLVYCLLPVLIVLSVFCAQECPHCQFKNEDADRYCLNCGKEIRKITAEEKAKLDAINKKQEMKRKESSQTQFINHLGKKKTKRKPKVNRAVSFRHKVLNKTLHPLKVLIIVKNKSDFTVKKLKATVKFRYSSYFEEEKLVTFVFSWYTYSLKPGEENSKEVTFYCDRYKYPAYKFDYIDPSHVDIKVIPQSIQYWDDDRDY